jgi:hypothetical protein
VTTPRDLERRTFLTDIPTPTPVGGWTNPSPHAPGIWVTPSDFLRLRVWSSNASATVRVTGRLITPEGEDNPIDELVTPTSDRAANAWTFNLTYGYLVGLRVAGNVNMVHGDTYAELFLTHGNPSLQSGYLDLCRGYVSGTARRSWPGGSHTDSTEGPGKIRTIVGTQPAAGADWSETVPTNALWRIHSIRAILTCDANVATRTPQVIINDGSNTLMGLTFAAGAAATEVRRFLLEPVGVIRAAAGLEIYAPLSPDIYLPQGGIIRVSTSGLQVGDQWGTPFIQVQEWLQE